MWGVTAGVFIVPVQLSCPLPESTQLRLEKRFPLPPVFTEPPILLERRSEPGGAVGFVKPVSPIRNSTLADPEALVFETLTLEEKRSACAGVPGELEAAPTRMRVRLFGVVTVSLQAPPDAAEQI